jgi:hypothetical protein
MAQDLSTFELAHAAYLANSGYRTDGSLASANAFIQSCIALLGFPERIKSSGNQEHQNNHGQVRQMLNDAQRWINANGVGTSGGFRHYSMQNFRG